jgi:NADPH-dependent glutamate synthase beta subunit-like oxidoreductase/Pyruvate/2-oxoacid:ferredoxin oxidoreductase delta subunit
MVGGKAFFRGTANGYSTADAVIVPMGDQDWTWLLTNMEIFLERIDRMELFDIMSKRSEWQLIRAKTPREKMSRSRQITMAAFRQDVWNRELGRGGLIGDLQEVEPGAIPLITRGELRRYVPVWENQKYKAPCQTACPTGIPVQERWHLIRNGLVDEALELGLKYTPFPATVCGNLCPSPCMASCTKNSQHMTPVNVRLLGRAGMETDLPDKAPSSGRRIAVLGAGPGGISTAWNLTLKGHEAVIFDSSDGIGGKISSLIPESRIARETLESELDRVQRMIPDIRLNQDITTQEFKKIIGEFDFTVVATGAKKARMLPVPGIELAISANDFLAAAKQEGAVCGKRVVIIGAGNVGCDAATEASRLGARTISMIDVQKPAAFGKEREDAEECGATFTWPCFTSEITAQGVVLNNGELIEADTVVVSIGDVPEIDFLGQSVVTSAGFIVVDQFNQTSDKRIFAIGDTVAPGLITDAIGAGKRAADAIDAAIAGRKPALADTRLPIDKSRISLEYFDPKIRSYDSLDMCGTECASCGRCRDCHICETVCPEGAIGRVELDDGGYEYRVDPDLCIGCGFCAGACPCGIWALVVGGELSVVSRQ